MSIYDPGHVRLGHQEEYARAKRNGRIRHWVMGHMIRHPILLRGVLRTACRPDAERVLGSRFRRLGIDLDDDDIRFVIDRVQCGRKNHDESQEQVQH